MFAFQYFYFAYLSPFLNLFPTDIYWFLLTIEVYMFFATILLNPGYPGININYYKEKVSESIKDLKKCILCGVVFTDENTFHCKECGYCVNKYDHHCMFLGKCIGKNNIYFFWGLIIMIFVTFIAMLAPLILNIMFLRFSPILHSD